MLGLYCHSPLCNLTCMFHFSMFLHGKISIYINNKTIDEVDELKYLGIYIDRRFSFDKYIDKLYEKAVTMLSKSAKISWGLGQRH